MARARASAFSPLLYDVIKKKKDEEGIVAHVCLLYRHRRFNVYTYEMTVKENQKRFKKRKAKTRCSLI